MPMGMWNDEERRELANAVEQALRLRGSYLRNALTLVEERLTEACDEPVAMTEDDIAKLLLWRAELKAAISPRGSRGAGFGQ